MPDFDSEFFIDYSSLDDFQRQLIDRKNDKSMVVSGSAGSGKSLIALHKAKQIAALGDSYTIIVYTKSLRKYFEDGLRQLGLRNVYHYHQWKHNQRKVKYLIVDECQYFTREEIEEMKQYGQYCLFFGDSAQSIMGFGDRGATQTIERTASDMGIAPVPLYFNYRLTKEVAALGEKVGNVEDLVLKCKRQGEKPNLISANSYDGQLDKIADIIKNRALTSVGILLPFNTEKNGGEWSVEYVHNYLMRKRITSEFKYNANRDTEMDLDFHSSNPKIMTWWCAKGLQFKDVFIPGCDKSTDKRAALYVAMTRCSERLYLGFTSSLSPLFPKKDNPIYNYNEEFDII